MSEATWFWIGAVGMLAGALILFAIGGKRTRDEEGHTLLHGFVPLFASIAYFAMAAGEGAVTLPGGRVFVYARYIDWSVTTPALLLGLSMTALNGVNRRVSLVAGLLTADVVMIVTGLFFGLAQDPVAKWVWYISSSIAFLAVYYVLLGDLRKEAMARDDERRRAYSRNLPILGVLWLLYPVVVILGPDGYGVWSALFATAYLTIIDLAAKVGYGLVATAGTKLAVDGDLARGEGASQTIGPQTMPGEAAAYARSGGRR